MAKKKSKTQNDRLTPKEAASAAARYLKDLRQVSNVSIEEMALDDSGPYWMVTLGFTETSLFLRRAYKIFKVDALTGDVLSMKMLQY